MSTHVAEAVVRLRELVLDGDLARGSAWTTRRST
jgi:hypothetical protein